MAISNVLSYARVVTHAPYVLVPGGLALHLLGKRYPPEPIAVVRNYQVPPERKEGNIQKGNKWTAPENHELDKYDPPNYWVIAGKGMQRLAAGLFLIKTALDNSNILIRSAAAVGTLAVVGVSVAEPKLDQWTDNKEYREMARMAVDMLVAGVNCSNIWVSGYVDFVAGGLTQQAWVGSSMGVTLALTLFAPWKK